MRKSLFLCALVTFTLVPLAVVQANGEEPTITSSVSSKIYDCSGPRSTSDSFIDYEHVVHCNPLLQQSPLLGKATLVLCLVLLLYLLSSTADEFFCPVLQAIVEKYRIPPHIAGVTFLSFGNGSPDVFSNIAAFATSTPSIGVTSIVGGGLLITTVITACVGLVSDGDEQLIPRTFLRDVMFYFVSVLYLGLVFFDGQVELAEAVGFLVIYFIYALVVFSDKYWAEYCFPSTPNYSVVDDEESIHCCGSIASEKSATSMYAPPVSVSQALDQPKRHPYKKSQTIPMYDTFMRSHIFSDSEQSDPSPRFLDRLMYRKWSVPTPRSAPHISDQLEPLGRHEGQSLLEVTDVHLKRPSSICLSSMQESLRRMRRQQRRRKTAWESLESSVQFGATARRWTRGYHTLSDIDEFSLYADMEDADPVADNLQEGSTPKMKLKADIEATEDGQIALETNTALSFIDHARLQGSRCWKMVVQTGRCVHSTFERVLWNPFAVFTGFVRRLTIPLVDEDTWDKNMVVICPPFALLLFGISVFSVSINDPVFLMTVVVVGGAISGIVEYTTSPLAPPEGWLLASFLCVAFVMSVIWIMNIANEVLAVLETLGTLCGISSQILGMSVSVVYVFSDELKSASDLTMRM
ncbi:hypothetical protein PsorP6_002044 [Peronosclerospora sorghi]|uniref:Uncharacterized protein n=1 Tax=Peronosclerospora sorghi TaxID=230839 RepID=A0ACC0WUA1_9STRA|nr:hypothetical protein PsorP6_002044 [Peronosclerospora sorghi]